MAFKIIEYQLTTPDEFFEEINKRLPSKLEGNAFILDKSFGKGKLQYLKVQEGFWAQQLEYSLFEELELYRIPKATNDLFLIDFYLSNTKIVRSSEGKTFTQSFENVNIVLSSSTTASKAIVPKKQPIKMFSILLSRDWLIDNVIDDYEDLKELFLADSPIYLSEDLDYKLKDILKRIDFNQNNRLTSVSNIIQIIDYLFLRFDRRKLAINQTNIHPNDFNSLMLVREMLDTNPEKEILLKDLSSQAGMSLSKFKRLFKQVLGTTPYRYHLKNKMEKAMETIQLGTHSISEIGFLMGYANLSQFSKAFKNHFGLLPSEVGNK